MGVMIETAAVTVCAVAVVRFLHASGAMGYQWIAIPGVLVAAALIPAWIRKRDFPRLGLDHDHTHLIVGSLGWACLCIFPVIFGGLWVLASLHLPLPLLPVIPQKQGWLAWLLYQFLYVAVAEEVFFRGYVQANLVRWVGVNGESRPSTGPKGNMSAYGGPEVPTGGEGQEVRRSKLIIPILVSAGCFALAHVAVQGQITSILTFLPGLVLAWLFFRTGTLLAPILFHGLANVSYALMAMALLQL